MEEISPLGQIEVRVQDRAKDLALDMSSDEGKAAIKALIDDSVLDWPSMLKLMTINPARIVGLDAMGLGSLAAGGPADITVIDPDLAWTIDVNAFASKGLNCPFDGWNVKGRSIATIVSGEVRHSRLKERLEA